MSERIVTGDKALDRRLKRFARKPANRIARAGLNKGARLAAKQIKQKVPSRLKSVRAAIGSSVKKSKHGVTQAKAGAAVGKSRRKKSPKRTTGFGEGISRQNVHWWVLGTEERQREDTGQNTGKMPEQPVVREGFKSGPVMTAIKEGSTKQIKRELAKVRRG